VRPLDGIRVVSIEHAVAAPLCTKNLSSLGADIIKVERPPGGDFARWYDAAVNGLSAHFVWLNVDKRSIALDLKLAEGGSVFWDLLRTADVFVSNLGPGSLKRLIGVDSVREVVAEIIECHIAGYSPKGPYFRRKAYDLLIQGEAGITRSTGTPDHPAKPAVSIADLAGGQNAALAIVSALLQRNRTGEGQTLNISLFDVVTDWMSPLLLTYKHSHSIPVPAGTSHASIAPYGAFLCSDGTFLNIAVQNEDEWDRFCRQVLDDNELLADGRYSSNQKRVANREPLERHLQDFFRARRSDTLSKKLDAADIGWGIMRTVDAVVRHPELVERHRWASARSAKGARLDVLIDPLATLFGENSSRQPAGAHLPDVGEHTFDVLKEIGYGDARLKELQDLGVFGRQPAPSK